MSKLTVHSILCKNFLKYGDDETKIVLDQDPIVLIMGKNGCGKSTLPIDALFYNWYGKSFRKGLSLAKLVNNVNNKNMGTQSEVTTPEGRKYRITRNRKPDLFLVEEFKDDQWNEIKPPADLKQYQRWLEEHVLRLGEETFKQVVVLGSSSYTPFMELDGPKRRTVIEDLLMLRIYANMNKITKERVKELKPLVMDYKHKVDSSNNVLSAHKQSLIEIQNRSDTFVQENQDNITKMNTETVSYNESISELNNKINDLQSKITDLSDTQQGFNDTQNFISRLNSVSQDNTTKVDFYTKNDICPECTQPLDKKFVSDMITTLDEKSNKIKQKLIEKREELDDYQNRLNEISLINNEISTINSEINGYNSKIQMCNGQIRTYQQNINSFQNQDTESIQVLIDSAEKECDNVVKLYEESTDDLNHYNALLELLKDTGVKADAIREELPIINSTIDEYLKVTGFNASFVLDESFNETIVYQGKQTSYDALSQGQKLRLNLVLLFVWREVARLKSSSSCSLLVLDEICDSSLDSDGIDALFNLMEHISHNGEQNVLVISHSEDTQSKFDVAYEATIEQGFSKFNKITTGV